ncbi:MAG: ATP synthase subunit I [Clostridia bacterium]|nr:ATP synthase subunit I [Clostridia bacterium]
MKKIDPVIWKETGFIALVSFILSVLMQSIFLIISHWVVGAWDYTVILGNLLGYLFAVGNFFLMCLTVQKALTKDEKDAANFVRLSQMGRMLLLFLVALAAYFIPVFNIIAVVIPFLFPRIAIMFRPLASMIKQRRNKNE